jgi:hypothetical protein
MTKLQIIFLAQTFLGLAGMAVWYRVGKMRGRGVSDQPAAVNG